MQVIRLKNKRERGELWDMVREWKKLLKKMEKWLKFVIESKMNKSGLKIHGIFPEYINGGRKNVENRRTVLPKHQINENLTMLVTTKKYKFTKGDEFFKDVLNENEYIDMKQMNLKKNMGKSPTLVVWGDQLSENEAKMDKKMSNVNKKMVFNPPMENGQYSFAWQIKFYIEILEEYRVKVQSIKDNAVIFGKIYDEHELKMVKNSGIQSLDKKIKILKEKIRVSELMINEFDEKEKEKCRDGVKRAKKRKRQMKKEKNKARKARKKINQTKI